MPHGHVNSGSQNRYNRAGTITDSKAKIVRFDKGKRITGKHHSDPPCWTGGTPVRWKESYPPDPGRVVQPDELSVTTSKIMDLRSGTEIEMLATFKEGSAQVVEYHPLIQFFNQVMAGVAADGWLDPLGNLDRKDVAEKFWQYIETKYLLLANSPEVKALSDAFQEKLAKVNWDALNTDKTSPPGPME